MNRKYIALSLIAFVMVMTLITGCLSNSLGSRVSEAEPVIDYITMTEQNDENTVINNIDSSMMQIPLIKSVEVSLVFSDSAVITWETDIESDGYVEYGNNELYGLSSYVSTTMTKMHRIQLQCLQPNTTYYFRIISSRYSLEGTKSFSQGYYFKTEG